MHRLGFMVDALEKSQLCHQMTSQLKHLKSDTTHIDSCVFYNQLGIGPLTPSFPLLQEREVWGYDGIVVATNLSTASRLINCPRPNKYFYIYDFEWSCKKYDSKFLSSIIMNPELKLITRSQEHFNIISKIWKTPTLIIEDFNHEQIRTRLLRLS